VTAFRLQVWLSQICDARPGNRGAFRITSPGARLRAPRSYIKTSLSPSQSAQARSHFSKPPTWTSLRQVALRHQRFQLDGKLNGMSNTRNGEFKAQRSPLPACISDNFICRFYIVSSLKRDIPEGLKYSTFTYMRSITKTKGTTEYLHQEVNMGPPDRTCLSPRG
jgi:hypothetical protein